MDFAGAYAPSHLKFLVQGLWVTLEVAFVSIVLSFAVGTIIGIIRYWKVPLLSGIMAFLVETVRNLPLLLIIFFTYFALPEIGIKMSKMTAAIVALVIFESAMLAEIVRGGLDSVHKGQIEAARSSGLNAVQTMRYVILPQGMRRMVPPIVSQFISLLKDTSLAVVIALPELMNHVQIINGRNVNYVIPTYVMAALMYFVVNYTLSVLSRRLESRQA
ncbi:amino acid ABC transporter permease [Paenibacillus ginsengarvi]|uniref:Amino acid ABC transporter permease n=1 Tax=Paenibacillus ginsengarvi TaxID=400777 RepID=A0A3B0CHW3_9BACL|nr:amino acid ABC transporter permease [Paenibacillus ginsengarvi]RKN84481.1 amino acid ABC transporter permease [Paenibacillus ginsengarvi]